MSDSTDCIFCKIASGQIPAHVVLDTADAMAFLDINPLAEGHTLVIPKRHHARLSDMSPDELGRLVACLPRLAHAVLEATGATAFNLLQNNGRSAGQVVEHVHFHIIPRAAGDGLGYRWNAGQYEPGRADEILQGIKAAL